MAKNNRQNSNFQIAHFLAGACHTPDGAYALLCDLFEDRQTALMTADATLLRNKAKSIRAQRMLKSDDEAAQLDGAADLAEMEAYQPMLAANIAAAKDEIAYILQCMDAIKDKRQFAHLPNAEAHEAAQRGEWKLELIRRAENMLLMTGHIAPDHFATMRLHPDFVESILPAIEQMSAVKNLASGANFLRGLSQTNLLGSDNVD